MSTVRKAPRTPVAVADMANPQTAARLLSQVQAAIFATLDQLVQRANDGALTTGTGNRIAWGSAPPTSGAWLRGDVTWNTLAAASGPPGWVCVLGGVPGTWKAMANLAA